MQLAVQALIFRLNVQRAAAGDIHRHFGIEGRIVLVQLLGILHLGAVIAELHGVGLVDARHIGAGHKILRPLGQQHIGARAGGVHILFGIVLIAALIHIVKNDRRCHSAGDIHPV